MIKYQKILFERKNVMTSEKFSKVFLTAYFYHHDNALDWMQKKKNLEN